MELIISFIEEEDVDNQNFNEMGRNIKNFHEAIPVIKEYETLINVKGREFSLSYIGKVHSSKEYSKSTERL